MSKLLSPDPERRPETMTDVLTHPFFTGSRGADYAAIEAKLDELLAVTKRIDERTLELRGLQYATLAAIDKGFRQVKRRIKEVSDCMVPPVFVIIPAEPSSANSVAPEAGGDSFIREGWAATQREAQASSRACKAQHSLETSLLPHHHAR